MSRHKGTHRPRVGLNTKSIRVNGVQVSICSKANRTKKFGVGNIKCVWSSMVRSESDGLGGGHQEAKNHTCDIYNRWIGELNAIKQLLKSQRKHTS